MSDVLQRARGRLLIAARQAKPYAHFDSNGYASRLKDNLVDGIALESFEADYRAAAGHELDGKFRAAHSSAALVVNTFAPWRHCPASLTIANTSSFLGLRFEQAYPTGLGGTPPHLDVVAIGPASIAVESKLLEYLTPRRATFSPSYDSIDDFRRASPWFGLIQILRRDPQAFEFLDVAQLVKHSLGLMKTDTRGGFKLVYLYWEPWNSQDFHVFARHRAELSNLEARVRGATPEFHTMTYASLWESWAARSKETWLPGHLTRLRSRYDVAI